MRLFHPRWMALCATLIIAALNPQLLAQDGDKRENITYEEHEPSGNARAQILRTLFQRLTPNFLRRSQVQPRSPWETPPTAYLPYPPPPNYVWPPGPHTQYPPPSETNAPGGWYGGTGTGGQGNSGAGSASNAGSTSFAAPRLRIPSLFALPSNLLLYLLPQTHPRNGENVNHARRRQRQRRLNPRDPVETPPTQFLPYPPPPNYQWPPGQNPGNQNPQPSEFDPPSGVYGGSSGAGNVAAGNPNANTLSPSNSGGGGGWGKGHVVWVVFVSIISTALVVGALAWWYRGKRLNGPPKTAAAPGEKKKKEEGGGLMERFKKMMEKFSEKKGKGGQMQPPPPAAAGAGAGAGGGRAGRGAGAGDDDDDGD